MPSSRRKSADMLPPPSDPNFTVPDAGEDAFMNLDAPEDESLLATGAWKDVPDDDGEQPIDIEDDEPGDGSPAA